MLPLVSEYRSCSLRQEADISSCCSTCLRHVLFFLTSYVLGVGVLGAMVFTVIIVVALGRRDLGGRWEPKYAMHIELTCLHGKFIEIRVERRGKRRGGENENALFASSE